MTTNYEKIKNMTIEEIARMSVRWNGKGCMCLVTPIIYSLWCDAYKANVEWLKSESEDSNDR